MKVENESSSYDANYKHTTMFEVMNNEVRNVLKPTSFNECYFYLLTLGLDKDSLIKLEDSLKFECEGTPIKELVKQNNLRPFDNID